MEKETLYKFFDGKASREDTGHRTKRIKRYIE